MNNTTKRFPRSTMEAYPHERYGSIYGPYSRAPWRLRSVWRLTAGLYWAAALLLLASIVMSPWLGVW